MPYRSANLPSNPKFTFIEKLFVSGNSFLRFLGHFILFARTTLVKLKKPAIYALIISLGAEIIWLVSNYALTHKIADNRADSIVYTIVGIAAALLGGAFVFLFLIPKLIEYVQTTLSSNKEKMQQRIINKTKGAQE